MVSPLGRVYHLPNIWAPRASDREEALRFAINYPVQGTASDIALMAMNILELEYDMDVVMFGHDSIIVEAGEGEAVGAADQMKYVMEEVVPERMFREFGWRPAVPLVADVAVVDHWS